MPRLPGTEEWDEDIVQEKARYYLDTMVSVAEMARLFAPRGRQTEEDDTGDLRFHNEVVDVRLEQFTEAIGLLLATDHTEEAVSLFANLTWVLKGKPLSSNPNGFGIVNVNIRQFTGLSLFAALAKEGRLSLGDGGLEYVTAFGTLVLIRNLDSEREFFAVLPTLFAIAVASNSTPRAIYERRGKLYPAPEVKFETRQLLTSLDVIANKLGRKLGADKPLLNAQLPDGSRLAAVIPPVVRPYPSVTIRKFARTRYTLPLLIQEGALDESLGDFLSGLIPSGKTVLISGGTGSGKTTLLNALTDFIPESERIVVIEDTSELRIANSSAPSSTFLVTRRVPASRFSGSKDVFR